MVQARLEEDTEDGRNPAPPCTAPIMEDSKWCKISSIHRREGRDWRGLHGVQGSEVDLERAQSV